MIKALIIEDEDLAANRLKTLLEEIEPEIQLHGPIDTIEASVKHLQQNNGYDLLFLDIQLADGKSFSIFEKIKIEIPVIFTTAYDEYAIKAFDLNSIDYLLKPINAEKLKNSIEKFKRMRELFSLYNSTPNYLDLIRQLQSRPEQIFKTRFLVSKGDSLFPINIEEVAYFNAEDKAVFLVTKYNKRYIINNTLEELMLKLNPAKFFRVNRQFLVSAQAISKAYNYFNYKLKLELVPNPGIEVIVSKNRTSEFKAWMNA